MAINIQFEEHLTHDQLNDKYGHRGRFFECKVAATEYKKLYKKRHPYKFCVTYPMSDAIMEIDHARMRMMNDGHEYYKVVGYKSIRFLVSTLE